MLGEVKALKLDFSEDLAGSRLKEVFGGVHQARAEMSEGGTDPVESAAKPRGKGAEELAQARGHDPQHLKETAQDKFRDREYGLKEKVKGASKDLPDARDKHESDDSHLKGRLAPVFSAGRGSTAGFGGSEAIRLKIG